MPSTYSDLKIQLMATGENNTTWGNVTNTNLGTALEEAIVGSADVTFTSNNVTLTLTDTNTTQTARNVRLRCTGTTGGSTRNLVVPSIEKPYIIQNDCADSILVKTAAGTGITVPAGKTMWVYSDGVNVVDVVTHLSGLTLNTALAVTQGGTGATSASGARAALGLGTLATLNSINNSNWSGTPLAVANGGTGVTTSTGTGAVVLSNDPSFTGTANFGPAIVTGTGLTTGDAQLELGGNRTGTGAAYIDLHATAGADFNARILRASGTNGNLQFFNAGTGALTFALNGSERMLVTANGLVGIGTSTPEANLDANGSIIARGDASGYAFFTPKFGTAPFGTNYDRFEIRVDPSSQVTLLGNSNGGTGSPRALGFITNTAERMRIDTAGNVGIGTSSPSTLLDVNGAARANSLTLTTDLAVADGGTGASTAGQALTNLGAYPASNPNGYTSNAGTVTSVGGTGTVNGITLTGSVTSSGNLTLGGALSGVSLTTQVTGTLPIANGGTNATTASAARINLGATTVGDNLFTLTNPSAVTFPRFNADNTVSALNAADFRTAIGVGTGTGTVTSVSGTGTVNGITLTGTVTSSGDLTLGGTLSGVSLTTQVTGTLPIANGGTGATTAGAALTSLGAYPASNPNGYTSNAGTVTSVSGTGSANGLSLSGTVTSSGNLTLSGSVTSVATNATIDGVTIGFRSIPRSTTSGTAAVGDVGRCIAVTAGITIPNATFAAGDAVSIYNDSGSAITITQGASLTLRQAGTANTGNRTLAARGMATIWFNSSSEAVITGAGVS